MVYPLRHHYRHEPEICAQHLCLLPVKKGSPPPGIRHREKHQIPRVQIRRVRRESAVVEGKRRTCGRGPLVALPLQLVNRHCSGIRDIVVRKRRESLRLCAGLLQLLPDGFCRFLRICSDIQAEGCRGLIRQNQIAHQQPVCDRTAGIQRPVLRLRHVMLKRESHRDEMLILINGIIRTVRFHAGITRQSAPPRVFLVRGNDEIL